MWQDDCVFFELDVNLNGMCVRRIKRVREKYEAELRDLERSERAALQKQQEMREKHSEMEAELLRLQSLLRQREQEIKDLTQVTVVMVALFGLSTLIKEYRLLINWQALSTILGREGNHKDSFWM